MQMNQQIIVKIKFLAFSISYVRKTKDIADKTWVYLRNTKDRFLRWIKAHLQKVVYVWLIDMSVESSVL